MDIPAISVLISIIGATIAVSGFSISRESHKDTVTRKDLKAHLQSTFAFALVIILSCYTPLILYRMEDPFMLSSAVACVLAIPLFLYFFYAMVSRRMSVRFPVIAWPLFTVMGVAITGLIINIWIGMPEIYMLVCLLSFFVLTIRVFLYTTVAAKSD